MIQKQDYRYGLLATMCAGAGEYLKGLYGGLKGVTALSEAVMANLIALGTGVVGGILTETIIAIMKRSFGG